MTEARNAQLQTATLAGGCFWCLDAAYRQLAGISEVVSGYAGGATDHPTYKQVCSGQTGHAEVVRIRFDPAVISYEDLLRIFFLLHNPTTLNRQGADVGTQYRSAIFYENPEQLAIAERVMAEVDAAGDWGAKLVTTLEPLTTFWPGEEEHQDYFARNPWSGYCQAVIPPKLAKLRKQHFGRLAPQPLAQ